MKAKYKILLIFLLLVFLSFGKEVSADELGNRRIFKVDSGYDSAKREQVTATLVKITGKLYFYVEDSWWNSNSQSDARASLNSLGVEFENRIYPILTSYFGQEKNPGIDNDSRITILFHQMNKDSGGYFRENDEYPKIQITDSNEREMIYLNTDHINSSIEKSLLAHEFVHLITFNQKNIRYGVQEDVWLNESRAEYVPTLLGYDDSFLGSNLEKRVQLFLEKPSGSLIYWENTKYDYGRINLFVHYLVDYYGVNVLKDSLDSSKTGISSINYALLKNGFKETFSQIFSDWVIAVLINDCDYGAKYCYLDKNLKDVYVSPSVNFLPLQGDTTLSSADNTKIWSGNWYKIIGGGGGKLKFSFEGDIRALFKVPYIIKNQAGGYSVNFMNISKTQKGEFYLDNFGKDATALYILPFINSGQNNLFYSFFWSSSITRSQTPIPDESDEITRLLAIIEGLKKQIADILAQGGTTQGNISCSQLTTNLYIGMRNNQVKCLQEFLKSEGSSIYPEGLVTGNFGNLTRSAVVRFQAKYGILQTGNVGPTTRQKINQLLILK